MMFFMPIDALKATIAANIKALMTKKNLSQPALATAAKVSQGTVSHLLNPGAIKSPGLVNTAKVAHALRVNIWHLCIPNLPIELLDDPNKSLEKLISCYSGATPTGRDNILKLAEAELRFKVINGDSKPTDTPIL